MPNLCKIEGCDLTVYGYGWCSKHYYRWKRHGSTDDPTPSLEERFWARVTKSKECWIFAPVKPDGYGQFWVNDTGRNLAAHTVAYRLLVDPDFTGELDHLCHTFDPDCPGGPCIHRSCVNPAHLGPVTRGQNSARGAWRRTACKYNHEFTPENTRISPKGWRTCRTCARRRAREHALRILAENPE